MTALLGTAVKLLSALILFSCVTAYALAEETPAAAPGAAVVKPGGIDFARGREWWSLKPLTDPDVPTVKDKVWPGRTRSFYPGKTGTGGFETGLAGRQSSPVAACNL